MWVRRLLVAALGAVLIFDSLANQFHALEFAIGLIMVGLIPVDSVIDALMRPAGDESEVDRLRQVMHEKEEHPPPDAGEPPSGN